MANNDLNMCCFIGRLGRDVETRYMSNGDAVSSFSIAVGWKTKDKDGAEWINITAFGKLGEICGKYLRKGSRVYVSGRFKTEKYKDKDGAEKHITKIIADNMQMLDGKPNGNDDGDAQDTYQAHSSRRSKTSSGGSTLDTEDDIPF